MYQISLHDLPGMAPTTDDGNDFESFTTLSLWLPYLNTIDYERMVRGLVSNIVSANRFSQVQPPWLQKGTVKVNFSFHKFIPQISYSFMAAIQLF